MNLRHDGKNRRNSGHNLRAHAGDRVGSDLLLLLNDGAAAAKDGHENRVAGIILLRRQSQYEKKGLSRLCSSIDSGRKQRRCERGQYIFPVFYGNLSSQLWVNAEAVAGQANPRHETSA